MFKGLWKKTSHQKAPALIACAKQTPCQGLVSAMGRGTSNLAPHVDFVMGVAQWSSGLEQLPPPVTVLADRARPGARPQ